MFVLVDFIFFLLLEVLGRTYVQFDEVYFNFGGVNKFIPVRSVEVFKENAVGSFFEREGNRGDELFVRSGGGT